jgi:glyoxalase family protein
MENKILGIHHITAIAGNAKHNLDFYTKVLGLRFVKKTVNFDDPFTYHFYFGDKVGSAGTILTFFPWQGVRPGKVGRGMATEISYSVPEGSFDFWMKRFQTYKVPYAKPSEKFGEPSLAFIDPDGLKLEMVVAKTPDTRVSWETEGVTKDVATKGFHNITLTLAQIKPTADILTGIFGYKQTGQEGNIYRFSTDAVENAAIVDLIELPGQSAETGGIGTIHHVAFRVKDDIAQMKFRQLILSEGFDITAQIDRNYFHSLYFREPGGVLFEIATDNPGFTVDEPLKDLGKNLMLPVQHEPRRSSIEKHLPALD